MENEKQKKEVCPTCGAIANSYTYRFDSASARLLLAMARKVREQCGKGIVFTEANTIHIQSIGQSYSVVSHQTITAKLGLIAKLKGDDGRHIKGYWVVTKRGWQALRGELVPAKVSTFRKEIVERFDEMTTLGNALVTFPESQYNPQDWFEFGENQIAKKVEAKETLF